MDLNNTNNKKNYEEYYDDKKNIIDNKNLNNYEIKSDINFHNEGEIVYFDVLTDSGALWISEDDAIKISMQIPVEEFLKFDCTIDKNLEPGQTYLTVTQSFVNFVTENTKNPKFVPRFVYLKTKVRERDFDVRSSNFGAEQYIFNTIPKSTDLEGQDEDELEYGLRI